MERKWSAAASRSALGLGMAVLAAVLTLAPPNSGVRAAVGAVADSAEEVTQYIVLLHDGQDVDATVERLAADYGFSPELVFRHAGRGFTAGLTPHDVLLLSGDDAVLSIERDAISSVSAQTVPPGIRRVDAIEEGNIDGGGPGLDIDIAIVDTGIDTDHPELNVVGGARFVSDGTNCGNGTGSYEDDNGHGTQVAGIVGAFDNNQGVVGVAAGARLWAVKVFPATGSSTVSCVIAGIDWVTAHANTIEVANMSLTGGSSNAMCAALADSVAAGVTFVVPAGNKSTSASLRSPANCPDAITVSAMTDSDGSPGGNGPSVNGDADDTFADFSNFGPVVDVAAPGVGILTTHFNGGYTTISGTSMASPHVAGAVALHLTSGGGGGAGPSVLSAMTSRGWTTPQSGPCGFSGDVDSDPEPMLYLGPCSAGPPPPPNDDPTADAGGPYSAQAGTAVRFSGSGSDTDGSIVLYEWDFTYDGQRFRRDTSGSSLTSPQHTYGSAGSYTVALRVTDDDGATALDTAPVTIQAVPNVAPTADAGGPYSGSEGSAVAFDGSSSEDADGTIVGYSWDFADGASSSAQSPRHVYQNDGRFQASLTVTDDDGASDRDTVTVQVVNVAPTVDPGGPYAGSVGSPIAFSGSAVDPGTDTLTYQWDFGDGSSASGSRPSHAYGSAGVYLVELRVFDGTTATLRTTTATVEGGSVARLAGSDRYGTAAAASGEFSPGVPVVYVVTGEGYADAVVAGPLGGVNGGPVLLVQRDVVPAATAAELSRLRPGSIVVLGGSGVVSDQVVTQLAGYLP